MLGLVIPRITNATINNNFLNTSLPTEAVKEIAGAPSFCGFLPAEVVSQALVANPSMILTEALEGSNQDQLEEPLANSTVLAEPEVESKVQRMRKKRQARKIRRRLTAQIAALSTEDINGQSTHGAVATGSSTQGAKPRVTKTGNVEPLAGQSGTANPGTSSNGQSTSGAAASGSSIRGAKPKSSKPGTAEPSGKRGRDSPVYRPESKKKRQEDPLSGQLSFLEATRKNLVLSITPLDSDGNQTRATAGDKQFITEKVEQFIVSKNPRINILDFFLQGETLKMRCLNQRTLGVVREMVSPLKGPRGNLQGYQCLGPEDRPPLTIYGVWVKAPVPSKAQFIGLLRDANDWLNPRKLAVKAVIPKAEGSTFLIGVEPEIKVELEKRKFRLPYGAGRTANFKVKPKGQPVRGS